jgi:hypothetical protein
MHLHHSFLKAVLTTMFLLSLSVSTNAQSVKAEVIAPDDENPRWTFNVAFAPEPALEQIKQFFLINVEGARIIGLRNLAPSSIHSGVYTATPEAPLKLVVNPQTGRPELENHYEFRAVIENTQGELVPVGAPVRLLDVTVPGDKVVRAEASDADDADVYISAEVNGAHKQRASFSTEVKLQRYLPVSPSWRHTPFFKLNASSDPDADPDEMELGWKFRYIMGRFAGIPGAYFDNTAKLESERDFDNTNLIYDARFTLLPAARPKGLSNHKVFINPYVGAELGKNLRSPLAAAEGDGIARALAGVDIRYVIFMKNEDAPAINWTTSYVRRWPLTDELGFEADDDGELRLKTFGKSPRDFVSSKFSYRLNKFLDVFTAYEWGQVPPSYKLVDHRFRFGFAYKYKFAVK